MPRQIESFQFLTQIRLETRGCEYCGAVYAGCGIVRGTSVDHICETCAKALLRELEKVFGEEEKADGD